MKFKKIIAAVSAMAISFTLLTASLSGCNKCEHVYTWTVNKEATCTQEGERTGVCGICSDVKTEKLPVDPDNHTYGDWQVTKPTSSAKGKAVKQCSGNSSHIREIELPALTSDFTGYQMTVLSYPTQLEDGERQLVYADEAGDVTFTVPFSAVGVGTVEDAIAVAVQNKSQVRKVYGSQSSNTLTLIPNKFFYEYGVNYTHIIDDGSDTRSELWYTLDENGEPYAVRKANVKYNYDEQGLPTTVLREGGKPLQDININEGYLDGYSFAYYYAGINTRYYGTEGTLKGVFADAQASTNKDFTTSVKTENGETVYSFSFGSVNPPKYYSEITVKFTLTPSLAIKKLTITSNVYDNSYETKWVYDEVNARYKPVDGMAPSGIEFTEFNQILISELSEEEAANVPVSPYDKQSLRVKSFGVALVRGNSSVPIVTDEPITINANTATYLNITDVENFKEGVNSIEFDPVQVYLRTATGDQLLSVETPTVGYYNPTENRVVIRFANAFTNTIVIKTLSQSFEKAITFNVNPVKPTRLLPEVRVYGTNSYIWQVGNTATVYVGQPFMFRSTVDPTEEAFADKSYRASVTSVNASTATLTRADGEFETTFVATAAGSYQITMNYDGTGGTMLPIIINVTVVNAPTGAALFNGVTYNGRSEYPRGSVTVTSSWSGESGTLTISNAGGQSETLTITLDGNKLTSTHRGGASLGFVATLDEGYHLILTHPTGFGDETETIIMTTPQQ